MITFSPENVIVWALKVGEWEMGGVGGGGGMGRVACSLTKRLRQLIIES